MPTLRCSSKVWQDFFISSLFLQFTYIYSRISEFCSRIALRSQIFPTWPPWWSAFLFDKKITRWKNSRSWKHMNSAIAPLSYMFRLLFGGGGTYGSLQDAGIWWCLRLGVGAFERAPLAPTMACGLMTPQPNAHASWCPHHGWWEMHLIWFESFRRMSS